MMAHTCLEAESMIDYDAASQSVRQRTLAKGKLSNAESVAYSAASTAVDTGAKMIIVLTESGFTARMVAKYKPAVPIMVITANPKVAAQCTGFLKSCRAKVIDSMQDTQSIVKEALKEARMAGLGKDGDSAIAIYGDKDGTSGSTNTLHIFSL